MDAAVGQDDDAVGRDEGEARRLGVRRERRRGVVDEPDVAEKPLEQRAGVVGHAQALDERRARGVGGGVAQGRGAREDGGAAVAAAQREGLGDEVGGAGGVADDERGAVVAEQALDERLDGRVGVDEVRETALDPVPGGLGEPRDEGAGLLDVGVDGAEGVEGGAGRGEPAAGVGLLRAGVGERLGPGGDGAGELLHAALGRGELHLESGAGVLALFEGVAGHGGRVLELLEARGVHLVLGLGVGDLVLELGVGERLAVSLGAGGALVGGEARDLVVEGAAARDGLVGGLGEPLGAGGEVALADAQVAQLAGEALVVARGVGALLLHGGELHAHVGEARDHVAALLLKQAHVGVDAAENVLHAAALLAEVAHEQALLLQQRLELLELAGLLVVAVLRELDGGVGLVVARAEAGVVLLQAAQVVDAQADGEPGELLLDVVGALGLVDLALERLELAVDLAGDDLGAGQVLVHRGELAQAALLAATVLGDVRGLLDELAALLGAARQDRVKLALRDDGVRVLAQSGVVQDVLDVHEARRRVVDEVLGLAGAVHAARDRDLGEVDRQRVVRVVQDERHLGEAHRAARRRAREDDVLHGLAAQHLGALLAEDPQDGVGDVGLARPVGAHDDREARVEDHLGLVGERLEALEGEGLEVHGAGPSC